MNDDLVTELRILSGSRKLYPSAPHGQMIGMETYKIVATGFALECIDAASDEIESLRKQLTALERQRDELLAALEGYVNAMTASAKAWGRYQNARENFSDAVDERKMAVSALLAASKAEGAARAAIAKVKEQK